MNNQEQVTRLRGLLERIQRNAARPRGAAPLPPPAAFAPVPPLPAAPPPAAVVAAPPVAAPPVAAAPPPAPPTYAPPPPAYVPPAPPTDESVDDLLGLSAPVPVDVDVDVPLDTLPPVAEAAVAPPPAQAEEEAIPLVSVSVHEPPPPPPPAVDDAFSLESEVSEVRVATAPRDEGPEVTVAAIEAEADPIAAEELSEEDLVELTDGTPAPATADVDIDFEDEEELPPASSQRKVASSMDEALAAAAQVEAEHDVPLKTPPPESGPQEAPAVGLAAPPAPDVDALLGEELDIPTRGEATASPSVVPTAEQLGQTIDLEEARGPELELAEPPQQSSPRAISSEELEIPLPGREVAGGYDDQLMPPPEARDDLEAHRRRLEEDIAPPPESLATLPSVQPGRAPDIVAVETMPEPAVEVTRAAPLEASPIAALVDTAPEIIARPAPMSSPESFTSTREAFRPSTFVELLDASLSLGGS